MNRDTAVIYQSKYGFTRQYAEWIAEELDCALLERGRLRGEDLAGYDALVYGGGLYAGGVAGIDLLCKNAALLQGKRLILFTCGLADPADPANAARIREMLQQALPALLWERLQIFHLRGGIDYGRLSIPHRAMMAMLRSVLLRKPEAERSAEDRGLLATYGQRADFSCRASIVPVVEAARGGPARRLDQSGIKVSPASP